MGAAHSSVLEAVETEFNRLARKKRYLTLQELVRMRSTYGIDLTHIGVLYRMDEDADGRFTLDELRAFASAAYSTVSVGFRRGAALSNGGGAAAGNRRAVVAAAAAAAGRSAGGVALLPPLPPPFLPSLSGGGGGALGWSGPEAMPGLHRDATYLVPAQCSLYLWRRTRTPDGRRAFLRWAARLFSEGGSAVVAAGPAAAVAAAAAAAAAGPGLARPEAMVREEALMGVHELFDLQRAHGLAFEAWVALLRAAAAEGAASAAAAGRGKGGGGGGGGCAGGDGHDPEDDAALLKESAAAALTAGTTALRIGRRKSPVKGPPRAAAAAAAAEEEDESGDGAASAALVPLSVLRVFAASVLDGAVSVVDGWFDPAELEPGGSVARATSSALMCGGGGGAGAGFGDGAAAAAAAAASSAAAAAGATAEAAAAAKSHMSRRSSSGVAAAPAPAAYGAAPLIPALW